MITNPCVRFRVLGTLSRSLVLVFLLGALSNCTKKAGPEQSEHLARKMNATMRIDGVFDDWRDVELVFDDSGDAPDAELDIGRFQMQSDAESVHLLIGLNRELNVQRLDGTLELLMDGDGDPDTGKPHHGFPGVDLIVRFSPENPGRPENDNMGVSVESTTYDSSEPSTLIHHSDIGFLTAPTYASDQVECRLNRNATLPETPPLFQGESFSIKLVLLSANRRLADETEVVSQSLPPVASLERPRTVVEQLPPKADGSFRLMCWNVWNGSILKKPDLYAKMLMALNPDIVLFEELKEDSAPALERFLAERLSHIGDTWKILFGKGGGPSRCAIASRLPIEPVASLEWIPYPKRLDRTVKVVGGVVDVGGRRVLVAPIHLKCCGSVDSWEDERRREEVRLINGAIVEAMNATSFDAVVVGGDLNLVGGRQPITLLGAKLDLDQSDLAILDAYHLRGDENATWASNRERFVPGRLDYLQYSDSVITAANAFVFDTADLSDAWLSSCSLTQGSSMEASDHLPVVADFVWRD